MSACRQALTLIVSVLPGLIVRRDLASGPFEPAETVDWYCCRVGGPVSLATAFRVRV